MRKFRRALAQGRNLLLDFRYAGRPLRSWRAAPDMASSAFAAHGTDYAVAREIMDRAPIRDSDLFVDVGCGYGRMLLLAQRQNPRARIVGVEIREQVAERAARATRRHPQITVVPGSVLDVLPSDASYIYMFNPFPTEIVIRVLEMLAETGTDDARAVLLNPQEPVRLQQDPSVLAAWDVEQDKVGGHGLLKGHEIDVMTFRRRPAG